VKVTIDPDAGFCFGVDTAIRKADQLLSLGKKIYCLGDIVHNSIELERLKALGMEVIGPAKFKDLKNATVLIRAHGEPPSTYAMARHNNIELIDATCSIVRKLQQNIGKNYIEGQNKNLQIVIFGKDGHAEVAGLLGQTENKAIIISNENDLDKIDFLKPVCLFSQTTMDQEAFKAISKEIESRMERAKPGEIHDIKIFNTICRQVSRRAPRLEEFARKNDVLIFVSGSKSSNGQYLFSKCKDANKSSYWINSSAGLEKDWFIGVDKVGVTGATSTPARQLKEVADKIDEISLG
jgi:4-hydroxy-3-methylbut-2-en-1-yl diphosphate reductase